MKIKHWMTRNPITVKPNTPILEASQLMKEHHIRRLPVVDKGKVVGIVTYRKLMEASPSEATALSIYELNYLIAKLKVKAVMEKDPICISPEDSVMDVAIMGHEKGIGAFPVVDRGRLVGIVTESEIYRTFVELLGSLEENTIIVLENIDLEKRVGALSRITGIIEGLGVPVLAAFSLPHRDSPGHRLHLRLKTKNIDPVIKELQKNEYKIGS